MKSQIYFKIKNIYVCNSGKENDVLFAAILKPVSRKLWKRNSDVKNYDFLILYR